MKLRLKQFRELAGMTQEDLARDTDLSVSTIRSIENNRRSASIDTLYKLAEVLDVTVNDLLFAYDTTNSTSQANESEKVS